MILATNIVKIRRKYKLQLNKLPYSTKKVDLHQSSHRDQHNALTMFYDRYLKKFLNLALVGLFRILEQAPYAAAHPIDKFLWDQTT